MEHKEINLTLNSHNGWQSIDFSEKKVFEFAGEVYSIVGVKIKGEFWEREQLLVKDCDELIFDRSIEFAQIAINHESWELFQKNLDNWKDTLELFEMELSSYNGLSVNLGLIIKEGIISSREKPFFSVIIEDSKSRIEWGMVIDSSSTSTSQAGASL